MLRFFIKNSSWCITINDIDYSITHQQYRLLRLLSENKNEIVSRDTIVDKLITTKYNIQRVICLLRKKIPKINILTVRGLGLILVE